MAGVTERPEFVSISGCVEDKTVPDAMRRNAFADANGTVFHGSTEKLNIIKDYNSSLIL
jgi:hypothetical protein